MATTNVTIQNLSGGTARIILFHKNTFYPREFGSWVTGSGLFGELNIQFVPDSPLPDEFAVLIQVSGGPAPGVYVSRSNMVLDPNWLWCYLQLQDANEGVFGQVSTTEFSLTLASGTVSCEMTRVAPYAAITHVFVVMLENHSFDHMLAFSGIPGITAATTADSNSYLNQTYQVQDGAPLEMPTDPGHEFYDVVEQLGGQGAVWTKGKPYPAIDNSGFAANYATSHTEGDPPDKNSIGLIMECMATSVELPRLSQLANEFAVCDHWYSSMPGPTWPNRFFVHGASSAGLDDSPTKPLMFSWEMFGFVYPHGSIYQKLRKAGIPYRFYQDYNRAWLSLYSPENFEGNLTGAVPMVASLVEVSASEVRSLEEFTGDLQGPYPYPYTFIEPHYGDLSANTYRGGSSQHPMDGTRGGEQLLLDVYQAIRASPYWETSLLIITYDEHGGFYDSVAPPAATPPGDNAEFDYNKHGFKFDQYGVRVPAIIVSPLIPPSTVDQTVYDHSSILKTIEHLWGLTSLTQRDNAANDLLSLLSLDTPRVDCPVELNLPAPPPRARPRLTPEQRALIEAEPLPEKGNLLGALYIARKTEIELSGQTPAEIAAIQAKFELIQTRGDARAYIESVWEKLKMARPERNV